MPRRVSRHRSSGSQRVALRVGSAEEATGTCWLACTQDRERKSLHASSRHGGRPERSIQPQALPLESCSFIAVALEVRDIAELAQYTRTTRAAVGDSQGLFEQRPGSCEVALITGKPRELSEGTSHPNGNSELALHSQRLLLERAR